MKLVFSLNLKITKIIKNLFLAKNKPFCIANYSKNDLKDDSKLKICLVVGDFI